jgi:uncharacterized protein YfaA (DUF2138 family)
MKKIFKDYTVLIISSVIAIAIVVYDMNFYWPSFIEWMEGNRWYAIIPFVIFALLNIYFPKLDKSNRSITQFFGELTGTPEKKKKFAIITGSSISTIALVLYFSIFFQWPEKKEVITATPSTTTPSTPSNNEPEVAVEKPEVVAAPSFSEKESSPFNPDIVILTKSLSDLPKDIVNNSFLSKIITKETMFYYEDDPQYLGLLGTLRRLSYEHNVEFKDNVFKYILSMPAEIALWKGVDGKIKDFLFISDGKSLNKNLLTFYLKFKKLSSDSKVRTFSYNGQNGYYLSIRNKELAIWNHDNKLYITNMHPKYFPDKNEKKLKEIISKKFDSDKKKGFYKRLYNTSLTSKHSIILNSQFLTFGYNYFLPSLEAIRLDFETKKWSIQSLLSNNMQFKTASTSELWKVFPKSTAMCIGLPVNSSRIGEILKKYKELTLKRLEEEKNKESEANESADTNNETAENPPNDPVKDETSKSVDVDVHIEKALLSDQEINDLIKHPVAACWYEKSTIFTPVFVTKIENAASKKEKIKFLFDKFIGGLEKRYDYKEIKEELKGDVTTFTRIISSKYGVKESHETNESGLKFDKFFDAKLAFNNDYLVFSPDGSLVDLAISTIEKKSPSIHDELKIKNKNISYLLSPFGLSQLLDKYMKEALPSGQESVFRSSIEKHLSSAFKNLSTLKSFGVDMPRSNESKTAKWEKLKIYDL